MESELQEYSMYNHPKTGGCGQLKIVNENEVDVSG